MRNNQNKQRMRGRNNGHNNNNNNNNHRKNQNPLTRVFESNGPDVKIRGNASHIAEKYIQLARDAQTSGDPVAAENYFQHAEHYYRLIAAAQEQFRQNQPQMFRPDYESRISDQGDEEGGDQSDQQQNFNEGPGYGNGYREPQPYQHTPREQSPQPPRRGPNPNRSAPRIENNQDAEHGTDQLPSFITGGAPILQAAQPAQEAETDTASGAEGEADRFPLHRRRRRRTPRAEAAAGGEEQAPAGE